MPDSIAVRREIYEGMDRLILPFQILLHFHIYEPGNHFPVHCFCQILICTIQFCLCTHLFYYFLTISFIISVSILSIFSLTSSKLLHCINNTHEYRRFICDIAHNKIKLTLQSERIYGLHFSFLSVFQFIFLSPINPLSTGFQTLMC